MIRQADILDFIKEFNAFVIAALRFTISAIHKYAGSFFLALILVSAAFGTAWYYSPSYFESDLAAEYNNQILPSKSYGEMCQKLNILAQKGAYNELGKMLGLPDSLSSSILSIEAKNRAGSPLFEDVTQELQPLYITLKAKNRHVFSVFEPALMHYLNSSPYQKQIGRLDSLKNIQKIDYLNNDLQTVDSIINSYTIFLRHTGMTRDSVGGFSNITALLNYRNKLEDQKLEIGFGLALHTLPSVSIIHGFSPSDKPERNGRKLLLYGLLCSLLVATGMALIRKLSEPRV